MRAKIVFDFIYKFLEERLSFTEKDYTNYYKQTLKQSEATRTRLKVEIHSKQSILNSITRDIKESSLNLIRIKNIDVIRINEERIQKLKMEEVSLTNELIKLKEKIKDPEEERVSLEEFLNLSKNAANIVKSANVIVKDTIIRMIFLNLTVDNEKVLSYQLKEPFDTLMKIRHVSNSRG